MPYTASSEELPSYVKALPVKYKYIWVTIFNSVYDDEGEEAAFVAANSWLKKQDIEVRKPIKRSLVKFELDTSDKEWIKRSDNGEDYITLKLMDTLPNKDGLTFTPEALQQFADQINSGEAVIGDFDHELYDKVINTYISDADIKREIRKKPSIAKAIKAIYEKGVLWVKTFIDKRYKKKIMESKGVSLEALCNQDMEGRITGGDLVGFTFNCMTEPASFTAGIAA